MTEYEVETMDDLDNFNTEDALWATAGEYSVHVLSNGELFYPVYCIRENGDVDGFMGWK